MSAPATKGFTGALEHDRLDAGVGLGFRESPVELGHDGLVQGVHGLGPVQGHIRDAVFDLEIDEVELEGFAQPVLLFEDGRHLEIRVLAADRLHDLMGLADADLVHDFERP